MNHRDLRSTLLAASLGLGLSVLAIGDAVAGPGGGGRLAQGSVASANRGGAANRNVSAGNRNNINNSNINNSNINNGNRNNINIGNDVDIDIDVDADRRHGWNDHHHPVAAGIVIGRMAVTRAAVVGAYYYAIPPGCTTVVRNGITYHYCGTVYYQRTWYGNDVVYVVVDL